MKKWSYSICKYSGLLCLGVVISLFLVSAVRASVVLARVGDEIITVIEVREALFLSGAEEGRILEQLVEDRLIYLEARRQGLEVSAAEVKAAYQRLKNRFPSQQAFYQALQERGMSPGDLQQNIRRRLLVDIFVERKIRNRIEVNPVELSRYLEEHRRRLLFSGMVFELSYTVFDRREEIPEDPADFPPERTVAAGKAPFFSLSESVQTAIAGLAPGDYSSPVKVGDAWLVFHLISVSGEEQVEERQLVLAARRELYHEKFNRVYREEITRLSRETEVHYYLAK